MDIRQELNRDHEDHEILLMQVAYALEARRPSAELRRSWSAFEENLFDHMAAEERYLFTVATQAHRREIEQLRAEHQQIRQVVMRLGATLEDPCPAHEAIEDLRALLRAHCVHEEQSLHRWLEMDEGILASRGVLAIRARRERASARLLTAEGCD